MTMVKTKANPSFRHCTALKKFAILSALMIKAIVQLMEIAAESLDVIVTMHAPEASAKDHQDESMDQADESEDAAVQNFRSIATAYYSLLDVQLRLLLKY